jgi:hypothetical protein
MATAYLDALRDGAEVRKVPGRYAIGRIRDLLRFFSFSAVFIHLTCKIDIWLTQELVTGCVRAPRGACYSMHISCHQFAMRNSFADLIASTTTATDKWCPRTGLLTLSADRTLPHERMRVWLQRDIAVHENLGKCVSFEGLRAPRRNQ